MSIQTQNTKPVVQMTDIKRVFLTEEIETHALRGVNLTINQGDYISISGPSGCGKSSLLSILGLLDSPTEGKYMIDGVDVSHMTTNQKASIRNQKIGFIFQAFNLIDQLSVFDNVALPLTYRDTPMNSAALNQSVVEALELVNMSHRQHHKPNQLSGGQQQRVAIARALAGDPRFLLADEPTGNLDSLMARQVMELLEQINRDGATIIMVTHDAELARRAPRNIQVVDGQLADFTLYQGNPNVAVGA